MSATARSSRPQGDPAATAARIAALNLELARSREIPEHIAAAVERSIETISEAGTQDWLTISPELASQALTAIVDAQRALVRRDEGLVARNRLRSALGRLSQALGLIAEGAPVSPERSSKELARWLVETLDVPQRELAAVLGVPLRTFQRWASANESAGPEGHDSDRLRILAAVVNQLRFSLTGAGVLRWLNAKNGWLEGRRPRTLLADPLQQPQLVRAARALREGGGG